MPWQIKGQAGKALNSTARDIDALNVDALTLEVQNLAEDWIQWTAATSNQSGTGTIIPDVGQLVELLNPDGVRRFKGHVTLPQVGKNAVTVKAVGPWWWLERIALSGEIEDAVGTTSDRASYVFPTQGLATSLGDLIDRAIAMGVPMAKGTISTMFTVPRITLSNMSFAAALAELMRWVPDAVAWFDYTNATPELNITRRGDMTRLDYEFGVNNIEDVNIGPRLDLEVARVSLKYVKRDPATGKPSWRQQNSGTATDGKIQIITISGPEIATILPKDDFDSVRLKTEAVSLSRDDYFELDPVLKAAKDEFGSFLGFVAITTRSGWHRIISGQTADWMRKDYGLENKQFRITAWLPGNYLESTGAGDCLAELKRLGRFVAVQNPSTTHKYFELYVDFTIDCINLSYPQATTVRKKWDYEYLEPPENLAANLKGTQDWVPWEGSVTLVADEVSGYNGLQRKFNLLGGHADHDGMNALVRAVTYDISRGRWTYALGTPARTDYGTLVSRIRREPSDNIVWIE